MFVPKPLRKLIAVFRGEVSPLFIVLSVALGFWFGLTPGWYGLHVLLLLVVLVLNVHLGLFVMFAGFGKALCYAGAPVLFQVGKWAEGNLAPLLDLLASLPILGITDFSRYSVAGALVLGPIIGLAGGLLLARSVTLFRKSWLSLEENSEAFRAFHAKRWVQLFDRLLVGKRVQDVREVLKRRPKVVRLAGVVVAAVVVLATGVGLYAIQGDRLADYAARSLTSVNGAEVTLTQLDLSPLAGRVTAKGVEAADPEAPARNRVAVGELTADASLWDLLRGKLVMDNVVLTGVAFDQARSRAGSVRAAESTEPAGPEAGAAPGFEASLYDLAEADVSKLRTYFENTGRIDGWLGKLSEWLPEGEPTPPPPTRPESYLGYLSARAPSPPTPRIVVRRVQMDNVLIPAAGIGKSAVTCTNLSDAPSAAGLPATVTIRSQERPLEVTITSRYDRPEGGVEVAGKVSEVDLRKLQAALNRSNAVILEGGTASAAISGTASRERIDLALQIETREMRAKPTGVGVFDLDPQVTAEAVQLLANLKTTLRVVGPTAEPRLAFDAPALTGNFRDALVSAGKSELVGRLDKLVGDELPGGISDPEDALKDPLGTASGTLTDLLGRQASKKEEEKQEEEKEKDKKEERRKRIAEQLKERLKKKKGDE
jgi:uncharacterized protein (TIGR03546 family)